MFQKINLHVLNATDYMATGFLFSEQSIHKN